MWALNDQSILKESVDAYNKDHPDLWLVVRAWASLLRPQTRGTL